MDVSVAGSILDVDGSVWDRLAGPSVFVRQAWLAALEESGTASPARDWQPAHVVLREEGVPIAACPLYLREGSDGEWIDDGCARFASLTCRVDSVPRAVVASPWTPVRGRRLLVEDGPAREGRVRLLGRSLQALARERGWASVDVQFCDEDEAALLEEEGFVVDLTWQYHWRDPGYGGLDGFLSALPRKHRSSVRRDLRELAESGVEVTIRPGDPGDFALMADLYARTSARYGFPVPPLRRPFYEELGRRMPGQVRFSVATRAGATLAMALHVREGEALYGRFWGTEEVLPFLHFGVAYLRPIQWCMENGIRSFEPGHGGEHKRRRGFDPVILHSAHWYPDSRVRHLVRSWAARHSAAVRATWSPTREAGRP